MNNEQDGTMTHAEHEELAALRAMHALLAELLAASHEKPDESALMEQLQRTLSVACSALGSDAGTVMICEPHNTLVFAAVHGEFSQSLLWKRMQRTESVASWVVRQRKATIVNDTSIDERFNPDIDQESGFRTRSLLASPILSPKGTPLGVLELVNKRKGEMFSVTDSRSLNLIAHAVGLVLGKLSETEDMDGGITGRLAAVDTSSL
jgi:GAF domain-containing protein